MARYTFAPARALALALAAGALAASPLAAQRVEGPSTEFGVRLGASVPVGDYGEFASTGWHTGVLLNVLSPVNAYGLRVDATYHGLGSSGTASAGGTRFDLEHSLVDATANLLYRFQGAVGGTARPYVIAGGGVYGMRTTLDCESGCGGIDDGDATTDTNLGLNVGGGVTFGFAGVTAFIEGRFHNIFGAFTTAGGGTRSARLVPISVGVLFR